MRSALTIASALVAWLALSPGITAAGQAPFVGDEGLEPRERRVEVSAGTDALALAYRVGYPRRTGVSGVVSLRTQWQGAWTTAGAGATYRLFGGYPLRAVIRLDAEVGVGPVHGPSLGLRFVPGVAAEVGREGRVEASVGASAPLSYFVLPEAVLKREIAWDGVLSVPVRDRWRAGAGVVLTQVSQGVESPWTTFRVNAFVGVARWL